MTNFFSHFLILSYPARLGNFEKLINIRIVAVQPYSSNWRLHSLFRCKCNENLWLMAKLSIKITLTSVMQSDSMNHTPTIDIEPFILTSIQEHIYYISSLHKIFTVSPMLLFFFTKLCYQLPFDSNYKLLPTLLVYHYILIIRIFQ